MPVCLFYFPKGIATAQICGFFFTHRLQPVFCMFFLSSRAFFWHLAQEPVSEGWKVWVGDVLFHGGCRVSLTGTSWLSEREGSFPKGKPGLLPEEGDWGLLRQNKHGNSRCLTQVVCNCYGLIWIVKPEIKIFVYSLLLKLILWLICFS